MGWKMIGEGFEKGGDLSRGMCICTNADIPMLSEIILRLNQNLLNHKIKWSMRLKGVQDV
jgi:hypothetical protein